MDPRQRWVRQARADLRELLDAWDPIGVRGRVARVEDRAPDDEYDCVRDRLLSVLTRGGDRDDVEQVLRHEVEDHFGLDPSIVTAATVDRIAGWWEAAAHFPTEGEGVSREC